MKTIREIIAEYIPNKDISAEMVDKLYEYKNQRVIDELENICNDEETEYIRYRIKELKQ